MGNKLKQSFRERLPLLSNILEFLHEVLKNRNLSEKNIRVFLNYLQENFESDFDNLIESFKSFLRENDSESLSDEGVFLVTELNENEIDELKKLMLEKFKEIKRNKSRVECRNKVDRIIQKLENSFIKNEKKLVVKSVVDTIENE